MSTSQTPRPSTLLRISVRTDAQADVVVLEGELDLATVPELSSVINRLLRSGRTRLVIDLDGVTFLDTTAVTALVTATCAVALAGGTLEVTHHPRLMALLELSWGIHRLEVARELDGMVPARPATDDSLPSLLERSGRGDQAAFADVYDATAARAYGIVFRLLGDRVHAAEVLQEAYLHLWTHSTRFRSSDGSAISWILVVVHRCAVNRARLLDERRTPGALRAAEDQRPDLGPLVRLDSLPRRAAELAYFDGRTHTEVEQVMCIPPGSAHLVIRDRLLELADRS